MKLSIKTILSRARAALVKYGWQQNNIGSKKTRGCTPMCIIGAINYGIHKTPAYPTDWRVVHDAHDKVAVALRLSEESEPLSERRLWALACWNNSPDRTKKEVLAALDKAIKLN